MACHCKQPSENHHEPMYYSRVRISNGVPTLPEKRPVGDVFHVEYIDIDACKEEPGQYIRWTDVPHTSKDYIFPYNCSIYTVIMNAEEWEATNHWGRMGSESRVLMKNLLEDGWNILKPGGSIVIPIDKNVSVMKKTQGRFDYVQIDDGIGFQLKNLNVAVRHVSDNPWFVNSHTVDELPFILGTEREWKYLPSVAFLSITKPKTGSKRKTRRRLR